MKRFLLWVVFIAALFVSCQNQPDRYILGPPVIFDDPVITRPFVITDYQNRASGETMPEWVTLWLNSSIQEVEALGAFNGRYVFISRNEGVHFNPLRLWREGFSPELDFPRLAAARIERRFASAANHPDVEYGTYYEALIRTASDAPWTGAVSEGDFWIRRRYAPNEEENEQELETWEFLILLTMEKVLFESQLDEVFRRVTPVPNPSRVQMEAVNRVREDFFNGF